MKKQYLSSDPHQLLMMQYGHGFNGGGIIDASISPSITKSSWEHNNVLIEIYETDNDTAVLDERQQRQHTELPSV